MNAAQDSSSKTYFLQDSRGHTGDNLMFWAKGGSYTSDVTRAEAFSEEDAFSQNRCRSTDIPWPTDYVGARTRPVVDHQYVRQVEAQAYGNSEHFYLQCSASSVVGNDILFLGKDGKKYTTNLNEAKVLTRAELFDGNEQRLDGIAWPKEYIDQRARPAADYHFAKIEEAIPGAKKKLAQPEKAKKEQYRCHGCGIFLAIGTYYSCSGCPQCGSDNRP